jgi:hypothetical protein
MPKHAFRFPPEVVSAVKEHVRRAIEAVDPTRYGQEANYTAALVSQLEGVAYQEQHGSVEFHSTVFDDRGPGSAESRYGADFAITATVSDGTTTIRKAILVQAKLGYLDDMSAADAAFLQSQIEEMKQLVDAPKVMEIPEDSGRRYPSMVSGNNGLDHEPYISMELPDYFTARVTTTLDGTTDASVVDTVQDSSLSRVDLIAKLRRKT